MYLHREIGSSVSKPGKLPGRSRELECNQETDKSTLFIYIAIYLLIFDLAKIKLVQE